MGTSIERSYFVSCPSDEYNDEDETSNNHDVRLLECNSPKLLQEQKEPCITFETPEVRDDNEHSRSIDPSFERTEKSEIGSETRFFCCILFSSEPLLTNLRGNTWDAWNCAATDTESEQYSLSESPTDLVTNSEKGKNHDNDDSFVLSKTVSSDDRYQMDSKATQDDTSRQLASLSLPAIDPYRILQIRTDASKAEITHAYKRLALLHHPTRSSNRTYANNGRTRLLDIDYDVSNLGEESIHSISNIDSTSMTNRELIFTLVSVAYETLIDRDSRIQLDHLQRQTSKRTRSTETKNCLNNAGQVKLRSTSTLSSYRRSEENAVLRNSNEKQYDTTASKSHPMNDVESDLHQAALNEPKTPRTSNNQKHIYEFPAEISQQPLKNSEDHAKQDNNEVGTSSSIDVMHDQTCNDRQFNNESGMDDGVPFIELSNCMVSQAAMTTTITSAAKSSNQHKRATKISNFTANVKSKQRIHNIVKGSQSNHRQRELQHTSSSSSSSSSASFAISNFVGSSNSSGVSPIYNFINRSTNTASGTSSEPADLVHYTTTETNRLFGGPLSILYQSRRYRYFTDPYILFDQVFHTGALTTGTGSNTSPTRNRQRLSLLPHSSKKVNVSCDNNSIGRQVLPIRHIDSRFPNLAAMKASSILDLQRRNVFRTMTERKKLIEKEKQKEFNSKRLIEIFSSVGGGKLNTSSAGSLDTVSECDDDDANAAIAGWYPTPLSPSKAIVTRQHVYEKSFDNTRTPAYVQTTSRSYADLNDNIHPPNSIMIHPNVVRTTQSKRIIRTSRTYKDPRTGIVKTSITVHTEYDCDEYNGVDTQNIPMSKDVQQQMIQPTTTTISTKYCHLRVCHDVLSIIRNSVNIILYPESFQENC